MPICAASRKACWRCCARGRVHTDPTRVRQILMNLIGNAVKFTEDGSVRVVAVREDTRKGSPRVRISVIDTGIGVAPEVAGQLFQPFQQADGATTRRFGGTGLGLAISRKLVHLMRGEIGMVSELGKGSTFWISMPFQPVTGDLPPGTQGGLQDLPQSTRAGRILVVEDNAVNRRVVEKMLERMGHQVKLVANGREACELVQREPFDLILMDIQMPQMDGLQATAEIRRREGGGLRIPIIALTASAMESDRKRCLAVGMDDYLSKPLNPQQLAQAVTRWVLAGPSSGQQRELR